MILLEIVVSGIIAFALAKLIGRWVNKKIDESNRKKIEAYTHKICSECESTFDALVSGTITHYGDLICDDCYQQIDFSTDDEEIVR